MRHVSLVALEALLIATIVWVTTMTLAGATQGGGMVGSADAGRTDLSLSVSPARLGASATVTAHPGGDGMWIHAACTVSATQVMSQWTRVGASQHVVLRFDRSREWATGGATCIAEEGYFSTNGRWRVVAATTFTVLD